MTHCQLCSWPSPTRGNLRGISPGEGYFRAPSEITSYNFGADWTKIQNSQHTSLAACCCIRVDFKIAAITFNLLIAEQSSYLRELLQLRRPSRSLRASNHNLLNIPRPRTAFGTAEFSHAAPRVWNSLPHAITDDLNISAPVFKSRLKTFL